MHECSLSTRNFTNKASSLSLSLSMSPSFVLTVPGEDEVVIFSGQNDEGTLMKEGNVSIILSAYTDIFSDFDPRPFTEVIANS